MALVATKNGLVNEPALTLDREGTAHSTLLYYFNRLDFHLLGTNVLSSFLILLKVVMELIPVLTLRELQLAEIPVM